MKTFTYKSVLAGLYICFSVCSQPMRAATQAPEAEWTIMVFMNGDNNLEKFAKLDFDEISKVAFDPRVNVLVQFDRNGGYLTTSPNWTQTLRFRMKQGIKATPADAVLDMGELNMGDGAVIADFVQWSHTNYPAKRYALIIWDHGQGWRAMNTRAITLSVSMQKKWMAERNIALNAVSVNASGVTLDSSASGLGLPLFRALEDVPHRSVSNDDTSNDKLFNREIQESLGGVLPGRKLDIIGFDACLMAMIETAFAMRNIAGVMVASEELEPGMGWNYTTWLTALMKKPHMAGEELALTLVESYKGEYELEDPTTTLSAIRLDRTADIADAVSNLANVLMPCLSDSTRLQEIISARAGCFKYAPNYKLFGIDLGDLCTRLSQTVKDQKVAVACRNVLDRIENVRIANYAASRRAFSTGLAIYFPAGKGEYEIDIDRQAYSSAPVDWPLEFVQSYLWDEFLHMYFDRVL